MMTRLAGRTAPAHVARCYEGLIDALVIDEADADGAADVGVRTIVTARSWTTPKGGCASQKRRLEGAGALR